MQKSKEIGQELLFRRNAKCVSIHTMDYLERKHNALVADLESAFAGYERLVGQVNSVRNWTIGVMVASMGWFLSGTNPDPILILTLSGFALCGLLILELRERSSMDFNKSEVLAIQKMLMIEDPSEYNQLLREYVFRDLRLSQLTRRKKMKHLVRSALQPQVLFWYGFWVIAVSACAIVAKHLVPVTV